ncbi:hypothetical protein F0562_020416 [Nyssa sinensis]|uniref:Uncharacterized protein n=1 Tax=Nyssa sinensis TaxID=561372 RepID=A0A5J5BVL8_9ASTE|nr:hypothetical protein F0562_020416 [Nyssa sinensis]
MENSELEEGEVCFSEDDDQDLSYNIDERIEKVLGHFRKDFEGLVSVKSSGSKFGGHGSFLPIVSVSSEAKAKTCRAVQEDNDFASTRRSREVKCMANHNVSITSQSTCSRKSEVGGDVEVQDFSYNIAERIEKVLGHLRKDFEGLVSVENLGSKFGGYGSFLPVDKRSIGKEEENVSASTLKKKLQTTCRKRKVGDVVVEASFSYDIDERIEKVLEHFQKDFEGLISVESLGSFLPADGNSPQKKVGITRSSQEKCCFQITSNRKRKDGDVAVLTEGIGIIAKHSKALKSVSSDKGNAKIRQELVGEKKMMKPVLKVVNSHSKKEGSSTTVKSKSAGKQEAAKFGSKEKPHVCIAVIIAAKGFQAHPANLPPTSALNVVATIDLLYYVPTDRAALDIVFAPGATHSVISQGPPSTPRIFHTTHKGDTPSDTQYRFPHSMPLMKTVHQWSQVLLPGKLKDSQRWAEPVFATTRCYKCP